MELTPALLDGPARRADGAAPARCATRAHGTRITYSPKVFIPLTMLCRDSAATARSPSRRLGWRRRTSRPTRCWPSPGDGARQGCHEALFTLGERPEDRYAVARDWLREHGYDSTVHYLHAMAKLVLDETGLLPHANAGALYEDELRLLAEVSPSQGMMLETLRDDLPCHRGAPTRCRHAASPRSRPPASWASRSPPASSSASARTAQRPHRRAARDRRDAHARHGHVQEVIVQNFLPKPGTGMQHEPPCPEDEYLWTIAAARVLLPPDDPPAGAAQPERRLRRAARRRHRRLGRRLARHRSTT